MIRAHESERRRGRSSLLSSCLLFILLNSLLAVCKAFSRSTLRLKPRLTTSAATTTTFLTSQRNSWIEFTDPETGCEVVLLGCLHGSQSSAADVEHLFPGTDVLVLELCEARFADLRKNIHHNNTSTITNKPAMEWSDFVRMVSIMSERGGWSAGLAAAVLGGMSGWQTALTGMTPGLEFRTGLRLALQQQTTDQSERDDLCSGGCDVVLADQDVSETLRRIGQLPNVSWNLLREWISRGSWQQTIGLEANSLHTAIWGNERWKPYQLRTMDVLTRNKAVIQDMIRVSAPSLVVGYVALALIANLLPPPAVDNMALMIDDLKNADGLLSSSSSSGISMISEALANLVLMATGYLTVLLPATRVIISERDDQLCKGIRAACRVALAKRGKGKRGRVLAVVGLLHVNGIAQRLLSDQLVGNDTL